MNETQRNVPDWKQRLAADLKRDKKKTVLLAGLVLVAAAVALRSLSTEAGPEAAVGAVGEAAATPAPQGTAATPPRLEAPDKLAMHQALGQERKITQDLFKARLEMFPADETAKVDPTPMATTQKALPTTGPSAAELEEAAIRAQATNLTLQSTMISETSTAIINGRVLRKGEWINNFEVSEILPRSCIVTQGKVKVVLEMKD